MDSIKIVNITPESADLFESLIPANMIRLLKNEKPVTALAAVSQKNVIGALSGIVDGEKFRIVSLYVVPSYRRKGAGSALVDSLKEILEEDDLMIMAEYSAVNKDEQTLLPFFMSCYFEEDTDDFPYYCKCSLRNFKARLKSVGILFEDIKLLSKVPDDAVKRAGNVDLDIPADILFSEKLDKDASFIVLEKGVITSCSLAEIMDDNRIMVYAASANTDNKDDRLELLSYTEEALKEKYSADTEVVTLVYNLSFAELSDSVFRNSEVISHRLIY